MSDLKKLQDKVIEFRKNRDWEQFHNPKDLAISLLIEATELLEHFQWKDENESATHVKENHEEIADEVADVLNYLLLIAHDLDIDIEKEFIRKLEKNEKKYPIDRAKGSHKKYTEFKE